MALPIKPSVTPSTRPAPNRLPYPFAPCGQLRGISGLLDAGPRSRAGEENWMGETFVCEVELHPRGERLGMGIVGHISIGYKA